MTQILIISYSYNKSYFAFVTIWLDTRYYTTT